MRLYGIFIALLLLHRYLRLKQKTSNNSISESEVKAPAAITACIYDFCAWHALHNRINTVSRIWCSLVYGEGMMRWLGDRRMSRQSRIDAWETDRSENLPLHVKWDGASDECNEPGIQHFAGWQISSFWSQSQTSQFHFVHGVRGRTAHINVFFLNASISLTPHAVRWIKLKPFSGHFPFAFWWFHNHDHFYLWDKTGSRNE